MDMFLDRLAIGFDNQGEQTAETLFRGIQDRRRKAHHLAEGFIIEGMAGGQEAVVPGEGQHGPGIHVNQPGGEPQVVLQGHGIDDVQHHGGFIGEDLPADVDILSAIIHEADDMLPELDGQMRPARERQHPTLRLVADDIDQDTFLLPRSQLTFAAIEIAFHTTKVAFFWEGGNTNK